MPRTIKMPRAAQVKKMFDNITEDVMKLKPDQTADIAKSAVKQAFKKHTIPKEVIEEEFQKAAQGLGKGVRNDAKYAGRTFKVNKQDYAKSLNQINTNKGEGFFKTILENASKIADSPLGQAFDKQTGATSFARGLGEAGKQFEGNTFSRAAQNAGYITKNAAGEVNNIDYSKIAKGYFAASAGARIVTGGGLYKDNQGNTNVIGVPLI